MSVRVEEVDVKTFLGRLESKGWRDGSSIVGVGERELVPFFFEDVLKDAVRRINRRFFAGLTSEEEEEALREVFDRLRGDNEVRVLQYLKYGVEVYLRRRQRKVTVKLIDYDKPRNNLFFYLIRLRFLGSPGNIEPDVVLYINGLPVVIVEVKRLVEPYSYQEALGQIRRYEMFSPELFRFVQFGVAVGDEERVTPTRPNWSREERDVPAFRWVVKERDKEGRLREYEDVTYILEPGRLLEYIRYFVFYRRERGGGLGKIIARYNQYYAAKKTMRRIDEYMAGGRLNRGLIWHWLGSGKTYTMFFIANYFLDRYWDRRPIVFFIVDRSDLEEQHEKVFKNIEEPRFTKLFQKIDSIRELHRRIRVIRESEYLGGTIAYGVYLTTIQKFQRGPRAPESREELEREVEELRGGLLDLLMKLGEEYLEWLRREKPEEHERHARELARLRGKARDEYLVRLGQVGGRNILLLIDEAHRTQYGILAAMRKTVFPNALAFGFTGTPVFKYERNTFIEFGYPERGEYYLDVYFIRDSIRDGFTLPLAYQAVSEGEVSREGVRIKLSEDEIRGFIEEYMKSREAGLDILDHLDPTLYRKVGKYINKVRVFLMNEERIDRLAKYIADRLEEDTEGFKFKAMVVAVNRLACVRFKRSLEKYLVEKYGEQARDWVEVVMTYNYNDRDREIVSYREELQKRFGTSDMNEINKEIQRRFLEEENPRVLVVTDMLITGFDAPILKVMYLDKPLYEHRLLQAIARVNRPYPDKEFGLIIDSVGLLEHLSKTLALYNMLADEEIRKDFEENLMENIDEKVEEFIHLYNSVKDRLSRLVLGGQDASIDLNTLKKELRTKTFDRREFEAKIGVIALYASSKEANDDVARAKRLLNDMRRTIKLYKALGGHPKKLFYVDDIEVLTFVYGSILKKMRRRATRLGKEFWRELIKFIHSRTVIDEFEKIAETEISDETLDQLLKSKTPTIELRRVIADYYFYLRGILARNPHDPIYREIMRRLERLLREWITRKIDLRTFLAQLKALEEERRSYEERIRGKPIEEKIGEAINTYIRSEVLQESPVSLKLRNTKKEIKRLLRKKITSTIKPSDRQRLSKALLKDLFLELGGKLSESELAKLADRLVDEFITEELERAMSNEGR
ncbi:MAG: HsdR family type I site-specific deoxyribonuclease [Desulfurococcales archaeon]|nr:HsdR family type I site-specific deoxyribonuclease [Desulfurococcales archaeon]